MSTRFHPATVCSARIINVSDPGEGGDGQDGRELPIITSTISRGHVDGLSDPLLYLYAATRRAAMLTMAGAG